MADHEYKQAKSEVARKQAREQQPDAPIQADADRGGVVDLQRIIGNQGVQRVLGQQKSGTSSFIQAKLTVGPADDVYEREADAVAKEVMSAPDPVQRAGEEEEMAMTKRIQRAGEEEEMAMTKRIQRAGEEEEMAMTKRIQRAAEEDEMSMKRIQRQEEEEELAMTKRIQRASSEAGFEVGGEIEDSIQAQRGGGQSLPDGTRNFMESRFGQDFGGVRVHDDTNADTLNQSLDARAFTTGQDIFFRQGEYNPESSGGQELLAHELTHVVQQGGSSKKEED